MRADLMVVPPKSMPMVVTGGKFEIRNSKFEKAEWRIARVRTGTTRNRNGKRVPSAKHFGFRISDFGFYSS
jgi:hypothetical protein